MNIYAIAISKGCKIYNIYKKNCIKYRKANQKNCHSLSGIL